MLPNNMAKGALQIWLKLRILRWGNEPGGLNVIMNILVRSGQREWMAEEEKVLY